MISDWSNLLKLDSHFLMVTLSTQRLPSLPGLTAATSSNDTPLASPLPCLWFLDGEGGQNKTQLAVLYTVYVYLLNVEETHTATIPDDHCSCASIPDPCPVNGADLAQVTPMEHGTHHKTFEYLFNINEQDPPVNCSEGDIGQFWKCE